MTFIEELNRIEETIRDIRGTIAYLDDQIRVEENSRKVRRMEIDRREWMALLNEAIVRKNELPFAF